MGSNRMPVLTTIDTPTRIRGGHWATICSSEVVQLVPCRTTAVDVDELLHCRDQACKKSLVTLHACQAVGSGGCARKAYAEHRISPFSSFSSTWVSPSMVLGFLLVSSSVDRDRYCLVSRINNSTAAPHLFCGYKTAQTGTTAADTERGDATCKAAARS